MNPARSLGPAIVAWNFNGTWIYITAPTMGAVAGALLFRFLRLSHPPISPATSPNTCLLGQSLTYRAS